MLSELKMVGSWLSDEPQSAWDFEEICFDKETQTILTSLSRPNRQVTISDYSAKVILSGKSDNHCYIPGQYFVYALKLRPLLKLLCHYQKILAKLSNEVSVDAKKHTISVIRSRNKTSPTISQLDGYSQEQFFGIFDTDPDKRLGAKAFIKNDEEHRTLADFFGSILLAATPVPNVSSGTLAELLLWVAESETVFQHLQKVYSHAIPWLFRTASADELMFRVMSTLGWEGKLDLLLDTELKSNPAESVDTEWISWGGIEKAFLLSTIAISSNERYFGTPVHYLESCRKYVFVRKGLLNETTLDAISGMVKASWPGMCVRLRDSDYYVESEKRHRVAVPAITGGTNRIFYGAPGTGKSHRVHQACPDETDKFVTVFHPDTQHADFVGSLKPVTEKNQVAYRFRPGPFTDALVHALLHPDRQVTLVIEEINRASAAAVFGELFQLLDRKPCGESTYSIRAADPDMLGHINLALEADGLAPLEVLRIPSNLSLLATMNSSDQAVMPLDTAFKRRWGFEYLPIDFSTESIARTAITLAITSGPVTVTWPALAEIINAALVECDVPEDRLLGPFFLSTRELESEENANAALGGKLFIYLWDDVLRHHGHDRIFAAAYKTYGALSAAFREGKPVFSPAIEEALTKASVQTGTVATSQAPDSGTAQDAGS